MESVGIYTNKDPCKITPTLETLRLGAGLEVAELSDMTGISRSSIYRHQQRGVRYPYVELIRRYAAALDVDTDVVIEALRAPVLMERSKNEQYPYHKWADHALMAPST